MSYVGEKLSPGFPGKYTHQNSYFVEKKTYWNIVDLLCVLVLRVQQSDYI